MKQALVLIAFTVAALTCSAQTVKEDTVDHQLTTPIGEIKESGMILFVDKYGAFMPGTLSTGDIYSDGNKVAGRCQVPVNMAALNKRLIMAQDELIKEMIANLKQQLIIQLLKLANRMIDY